MIMTPLKIKSKIISSVELDDDAIRKYMAKDIANKIIEHLAIHKENNVFRDCIEYTGSLSVLSIEMYNKVLLELENCRNRLRDA